MKINKVGVNCIRHKGGSEFLILLQKKKELVAHNDLETKN